MADTLWMSQRVPDEFRGRMNLEVGLVPIVMLRTKAAWAELDNDRRAEWLENKRAGLTEYQVPPNGVFWVDGMSNKENDIVLMLWNLVDEESVLALRRLMEEDDVREFFGVTIFGGDFADEDAMHQAFFRRD
jgi:hypothetical protein